MWNWRRAAKKDKISELHELFFDEKISDDYLREIFDRRLSIREVFDIFERSPYYKFKKISEWNTQNYIDTEHVTDSEKVSNGLDLPLSPESVEEIFEIILKRPTNDPAFVKECVEMDETVGSFLNSVRDSPELQLLMKKEYVSSARLDSSSFRAPEQYRVPKHLRVSSSKIRRVLGVGSCWLEQFTISIADHVPEVDFELYLNGWNLPDDLQAPVNDYQFQMVQVPLRSVLPDLLYPRLSDADEQGHASLLDHALDMVRRLFTASMKYNIAHDILTFVIPFPVPQQNHVGRLLPRRSLSNPVYFIEQLNLELESLAKQYNRTHFVDCNEISATIGKRFSFEDSFAAMNHGGITVDFDHGHDLERIEPSLPATTIYDEDIVSTLLTVWHETEAMYRTIHQIDSVKMVVIDLDDTLWRGIIGELDLQALPTKEGWPLGFWEALLLLKRRGILLAIISKNEESRVREAWPHIMGSHGLKLEDFAIHRINWEAKSKNMEDILSTVNLLPDNVVYIDDNPAQRNDIKKAFPTIRVLGGTPFTWRHILLWAPETQVAAITAESGQRTTMMQAQVEREGQRKALSQQEFLEGLGLEMKLFAISAPDHPRIPRVMELINKTNQFNTTGKRWGEDDLKRAFDDGWIVYCFDLSDKFTEYGLVGILMVEGNVIRQFVMSCRVMGLEAETASIAAVCTQIRAVSDDAVIAEIVETERNLPCRNVYDRAGFRPVGGRWVLEQEQQPSQAAHIAVTLDAPARQDKLVRAVGLEPT